MTRPTLFAPVAAISAALPVAFLVSLAACTPTVQIATPDKPIEINLNIRIEQEVRVRVERDLERAILDDPALFGLPPNTVPTPAVPTPKGKTP